MGSTGSKLISFRGILRPPPLRLTAFLACAVISLSAAGALPVLADTTTPAPDLRQTARDYFVSANYDKAIETYNALLSQQPPDALSIKIDLGLCYKAAKDYPNALKLFAEVASSDSTRKVEALFFTEDSYCEQGKVPDAVTVLTRAYNECPEARADVLLRRAARLCDIGKYEECYADYQEFVANFPDRKEAIAAFSPRLPELRLRSAGIFDGPASALEAEWDAAKAQGNDDAYVELVGCRLGLAYKTAKEYDKAIRVFQETAKNATGDRYREITFWTLDSLTEPRRNEEALSLMNTLLAQRPDWKAPLLYRRAVCLGELRRTDECVACWEQLINECPAAQEAVTAQVALADVELFTKRETAAARARLQRMIHDYPDYPDPLYVRDAIATTYYAEGDFARAAEAYAEGLRQSNYGTWHPFLLYMMGDCYKNLGDTAKAKEAWDKLLSLYPGDSWVPLVPNLCEQNIEEAAR